MRTHTVQQGECFASIAALYGFHDPKKLFDHGDNADLKELRKTPFVLKPGDQIALPDFDEKWVSCATGKLHDFSLKVPKVWLRVLLRERDGTAISGKKYVLRIEKEEDKKGTTGGDGLVEQEVPAAATSAELLVFVDGAEDESEALSMTVRIGHLDPVDTLSGVQARLRNLGIPCPVSDAHCDDTRAALRVFQEREKLDVTGEIDDATRSKLKSAHEGV